MLSNKKLNNIYNWWGNILNYYKTNNYKGLILEMSGLGHAPTNRSRNSWVSKLKELIKKALLNGYEILMNNVKKICFLT